MATADPNDPRFLSEDGLPLTEEEKRHQEAAALVVQALWKGREDRLKLIMARNAKKARGATNARWGLIQGRFTALRPDFEGILRWSELTHMFLPANVELSSKVVLNNLSGKCHAGTMTTITGPPSCGKSTLLHLLGKARLPGLTQGEVTLNAVSVNDVPDYHRKVGYVLDDDALLRGLTVKEQIMFAAKLRLNATDEFRKGRVEKALQFMGLGGETATTPLGSVSKADQRRTAIAVELVTYPPVLLVDDPTEGLDSSAAYHMMETLSKMAAKITVLIGMSAADLGDSWEHMEDMYVLSGGRLCYYGAAKGLTPWLKKVGFNLPVETNPGDYMVRLIDDTFEDYSEKTVDKMIFTTYNQDLVKKMNSQAALVTPPMHEYASKPTQQDNQSMWTEMKLLFSRYMKDGFLNPTKYPLQILLTACMGVILGTLFMHIDHDMLETDAPQLTKLFFTLTFMSLSFTVRPSGFRMADEKPVVLRELQGGFYRAFSYYFVQFMVHIAEAYVFVTILVAIMLSIPGLIQSPAKRGQTFELMGEGMKEPLKGFQPNTGWLECQQSCAWCEHPVFLENSAKDPAKYPPCVIPINGWNDNAAPIPYKNCEDLIVNVGVPVVFCPTEDGQAKTYFKHVWILTFAAFATSSLTFLITMVADTKNQMYFASALADITMLLFSGFLVSDNKMPYMWYWLFWTSHHNYAYRTLLHTEFIRRYVIIKTGVGVRVGSEAVASTSVSIPGYKYLDNEGFQDSPHDWINFLILISGAIGYRILAALVIKLKYLTSVYVFPSPTKGKVDIVTA